MKISILNECFFNESDFKKLEDISGEKIDIFYDTYNEKLAVERLNNTDIAIVDPFFTPLKKEIFSKLKRVKYIALNVTGYEMVDIVAAKQNGIMISDVQDVTTNAVAEGVIGLMLAVGKKFKISNEDFLKQPFEADPGQESSKKYLGMSFAGKTMGVVGFGNIAQRVAALAKGLGMEVVVYNRTSSKVKGYQYMDLDELLKKSDVISLNVALEDDNKNMINKDKLDLVKKDSIIINTARQELIDVDYLAVKLLKGEIFGYGSDVTVIKDKNHSIYKHDNVLLLPHTTWYTQESLRNIAKGLIDNVKAFIKGKPKNVINP